MFQKILYKLFRKWTALICVTVKSPTAFPSHRTKLFKTELLTSEKLQTSTSQDHKLNFYLSLFILSLTIEEKYSNASQELIQTASLVEGWSIMCLLLISMNKASTEFVLNRFMCLMNDSSFQTVIFFLNSIPFRRKLVYIILSRSNSHLCTSEILANLL